MEEIAEKQIWRQMQGAVRYAGSNVERNASSASTGREVDCREITFSASRMRENHFSSTGAVDFCGVEGISAGE